MIGWRESKIPTRIAWERFRKDRLPRTHDALQVMEELLARYSGIEEFIQARDTCGSWNPEAILHFLDYQRALAKEQDDDESGAHDEEENLDSPGDLETDMAFLPPDLPLSLLPPEPEEYLGDESAF